jgi:hypothetical protein
MRLQLLLCPVQLWVGRSSRSSKLGQAPLQQQQQLVSHTVAMGQHNQQPAGLAAADTRSGQALLLLAAGMLATLLACSSCCCGVLRMR